MEESPLDQIPHILALARNAFSTGRTIDLSFRKQQLKQLHLMLTKEAKTLSTALYKDLHKPEIEGLLPEVIMTQNEALEALENLDDWAKPHFPSVPLMNMGDNCQIRYQPFGVCLIIGAWNYPVQLILLPLVGVIAAGNCAILKPSELAPHTAAALAEIIPKYLDKDCFRVVNGGVPQTTALLDQRFDHILYTGSSPVGKIIMGAAAKNLTPVTLELGGKSPTIVDKQVNVANAARRIIWGKFYNAGQTCIAPDYVLCAKGLEESLIKEMKAAILEFYGSDPKNSKSFARIINKRHFDRVRKMIEESSDQVVAGGDMDGDQLYISPTIILQPQLTSTVMREEIFGPVLPIISVSDVGAAIAFINEREKPLALYMFSTNQSSIDKVLNYTSSGGVVINDVLMHATVSSLPFGGVGNSGMGAYHGKHSFELFSHKRSTMVKKMGLEFLNQIRYPPYNPSKSAQILKVVTKSPSVLSASLRKIILLVILAIFLVRNPQNRIARAIRVLLGFD